MADAVLIPAPSTTAPSASTSSVVPLLAVAAATIAVGVVTGRRDIVRGGAGLAAVQIAGSVLRSVAHRLDGAAAAPPPVVIDAVALWLAETAVSAAIARFDPPEVVA